MQGDRHYDRELICIQVHMKLAWRPQNTERLNYHILHNSDAFSFTPTFSRITLHII